jgi:hypothetical protein
MTTIAEFKERLQGIRSWAEFSQLLNGTPKAAEVLYGPYDAIWPTVGVKGSAWFCLWCGSGDGDLPSSRIALASGESHAECCHPDVDFTFIEVLLDPDEVR